VFESGNYNLLIEGLDATDVPKGTRYAAAVRLLEPVDLDAVFRRLLAKAEKVGWDNI